MTVTAPLGTVIDPPIWHAGGDGQQADRVRLVPVRSRTNQRHATFTAFFLGKRSHWPRRSGHPPLPRPTSHLRTDPGAQVVELAGLHDEMHRFPQQQAERPGK